MRGTHLGVVAGLSGHVDRRIVQREKARVVAQKDVDGPDLGVERRILRRRCCRSSASSGGGVGDGWQRHHHVESFFFRVDFVVSERIRLGFVRERGLEGGLERVSNLPSAMRTVCVPWWRQRRTSGRPVRRAGST